MINHVIRLSEILILLFPSWLGAVPQDHPKEIPRRPDLVLEAKPTKPVYARGEGVGLNFTLRNVSNRKLIVSRHLQLTLNVALQVSGSEGRPAKWCGRIADQIVPVKNRYATLAPGKSILAELTISCVNRNDPRHAWGYTIETPGKYVIKATYRLPQSEEYFKSLFPDEEVDRGPVMAEAVTIEVQ